MPLPKPNDNEKLSDFLSRCMGNDVMNSEYPDSKQRAAACYSIHRQSGEKRGPYGNSPHVGGSSSTPTFHSRINDHVPSTIFYHGTTLNLVDEVIKEGLEPQKASNRIYGDNYHQDDRAKSVFLTNDIEEAKYWGSMAANVKKIKDFVIFKVDTKDLKLVPDEAFTSFNVKQINFRTMDKIDTHMIKGYGIYKYVEGLTEKPHYRYDLIEDHGIKSSDSIMYFVIVADGETKKRAPYGRIGQVGGSTNTPHEEQWVWHSPSLFVVNDAQKKWEAYTDEYFKTHQINFSDLHSDLSLRSNLLTEAVYDMKHLGDKNIVISLNSKNGMEGLISCYHNNELFAINELASAPWNSRFTNDPMKTKGVGTRLLYEAFKVAVFKDCKWVQGCPVKTSQSYYEMLGGKMATDSFEGYSMKVGIEDIKKFISVYEAGHKSADYTYDDLLDWEELYGCLISKQSQKRAPYGRIGLVGGSSNVPTKDKLIEREYGDEEFIPAKDLSVLNSEYEKWKKFKLPNGADEITTENASMATGLFRDSIDAKSDRRILDSTETLKLTYSERGVEGGILYDESETFYPRTGMKSKSFIVHCLFTAPFNQDSLTTRRAGIGSKLLFDIFETGLKEGVQKVTLAALPNAVPFYQESGFSGKVFPNRPQAIVSMDIDAKGMAMYIKNHSKAKKSTAEDEWYQRLLKAEETGGCLAVPYKRNKRAPYGRVGLVGGSSDIPTYNKDEYDIYKINVLPGKSKEEFLTKLVDRLKRDGATTDSALAESQCDEIFDTLNWVQDYTIMTREGRSFPDEKIDKLFNPIRPGIIHMVNKDIDFIQNHPSSQWKPSVEVIDKLKKISLSASLAKTRLEKVVVIEKVAAMQHTYEESIIPRMLGVDRGNVSGEISRDIRRVFIYLAEESRKSATKRGPYGRPGLVGGSSNEYSAASKKIEDAIKIYGITKTLSPYQATFVLPDGRMLDLDDNGHHDLGVNDFSRETGVIRLRTSPSEIDIDFVYNYKPTDEQVFQIMKLSRNKKIVYIIVDENDDAISGYGGDSSIEKMITDIDNYYKEFKSIKRGPYGRPGHVGGSSNIPTNESHEDGIKEYLGIVSKMHKDMPNSRLSGWKYTSMEDAVLQLGSNSTPQDLPKEYKWGKEKECYANAARLAASDSSLTYNEGFASTFGLPLPHAWCTDKNNMVIDNTWKPKLGDFSKREYYGIKFDTKYLWDTLAIKKTYGLFPDFYMGKYNPLKDGFPAGAVKAIKGSANSGFHREAGHVGIQEHRGGSQHGTGVQKPAASATATVFPKENAPVTSVVDSKQKQIEWIKSLSEEQLNTIGIWQGGGFDKIRKGEIGEGEFVKIASEFNNVLDSDGNYVGTTFRGISGLSDSDFNELMKSKEIVFKSSASSSKSKYVAEYFTKDDGIKNNVLFRITGKTGVDISLVYKETDAASEEYEVVLRKGTRYAVVGVVETPEYLYMNLEEK